MVGDYMSTSFAGANYAFPIFAVAKLPRRAPRSTSACTARGSTSRSSPGRSSARGTTASGSRSTTWCPTSSYLRSRSRNGTPERINIGGNVGERARRARSIWTAVAVAVLGLLVVATVSAGSVIPTPISDDPYTDGGSRHQHKTQLEPDSFAFGQTIVALTQSGRWFGGGGSSNLVFLDLAERRPHVDDGRPTGNHRSTRAARGPGSAIRRSRSTRRTTSGSRSASGSTTRWARAHPARQPLHRRRPDVVEPRQRGHGARDLLGQDLDHVRHVGAEPALRQLLRRVRRQQRGQRHEHGHVDRRRPHVEPGAIAAAARQGSAASRSCSRTETWSCRTRTTAVQRARSARLTAGPRWGDCRLIANVQEHGVAANIRTFSLPSGRGCR